MSQDLTDADRAAIKAFWEDGVRTDFVQGISHIYRAGLAAGLKRKGIIDKNLWIHGRWSRRLSDEELERAAKFGAGSVPDGLTDGDFQAGLAAGNRERDQMQRVIDAAKAMRGWAKVMPGSYQFDAALAALERGE